MILTLNENGIVKNQDMISFIKKYWELVLALVSFIIGLVCLFKELFNLLNL